MSPSKDTQSSSYRLQKATAADLSIFEKLDTIPALFTVFANAIFAIVTGVTRAKDRRPRSYFNYVALTALRTFGSRTTVRQQHYLLPPTDDEYRAACKRRNQQPNSETLSDGTRAHWIGSSNASKIILNFHGGGYVIPASKEMFEFMFQVVTSLQKEGKTDVACLMLSYDLAPGAPYPRQLQQASMLLNHVLSVLKIAPENIILSGDSAGANLALALLSHISHPHPSTTVSIPKIELPDGKELGGVCLISPWVSFDMAAESFKENQYKDCISTSGGKKWSAAFLACPWPHEEASDNYNQAIKAPESWWRGLRVRSVLIVAGEEEVLLDGIKEFAGRLRKGIASAEDGNAGKKVEVRLVRGEYHDQPSVDLQLGYKEESEGVTAKEIKRWFASKL